MKVCQNRINITIVWYSWSIVYRGITYDELILSFSCCSLLKLICSLESVLHQNIRILVKWFSASTFEPLKFKCRPSLFKCDGVMLLWKITFFASFFKMLVYFLSMLFASCLSVPNNRRWHNDIWISNLDAVYVWFVWHIKILCILDLQICRGCH